MVNVIRNQLKKILNGSILGKAGYLSPTGNGWNFPYEGYLTEIQIRALAEIGYVVTQVDTNKGHIHISKIFDWDSDFILKRGAAQ